MWICMASVGSETRGVAGRVSCINSIIQAAPALSSEKAKNREYCAHDMVCDDPCHVAWQVKKISRLDSAAPKSLRPLSARPTGESDSTADNFQDAASSRCFSNAGESDSPATQRGRGLIGNRKSTSS